MRLLGVELKVKGKVYIVGAGPGRLDLLTLRAVSLLQKADVVLFDRLIPREALKNFAPQARFIDVGKKAAFHTLSQTEIEEIMVKEALKGYFVVRLKGGDPFIFGRGGEECQTLVAKKIPFEVVPGVSSALAVPLYAGIPLSHRDHTAEIVFVTGHETKDKTKCPYPNNKVMSPKGLDWRALAQMRTIVFLMGVGHVRSNMQKLMDCGKSAKTPAAAIRWGGLGCQKTLIATVKTLADLIETQSFKPPAVIVVGDVVGLAESLQWFEKQPLYGQRILITRDEEANLSLSQALLEKSAEAISWPSFRFKEVTTSQNLRAQINQIDKYDWLIFSSKRCVDFFLHKFNKQHADFRILAGVKIVAIGSETAAHLKKCKLWVDYTPKQPHLKSLIQDTYFKRLKKKRIFVPQAKDTLYDLKKEWAGKHEVHNFAVYRKQILKQDAADVNDLLEHSVDWILFFSPSAVRAFVANFKNQKMALKVLSAAHLAVIGPTTEAYLRSLGLKVDLVSKKSSQIDLISKIEATLLR